MLFSGDESLILLPVERASSDGAVGDREPAPRAPGASGPVPRRGHVPGNLASGAFCAGDADRDPLLLRPRAGGRRAGLLGPDGPSDERKS